MTDDPDVVWRRPPADAEPAPVASPATPPVYTGPPRSVPPPPEQFPAPLIQPLPPPRDLPPQDHEAIDAEEEQARIITLVVTIAGAVLAVLLVFVIAIRSLGN